MNILLRLKPYQLFLVTVIPMATAPFGTIGTLLSLIGYLLYLFWIYAIGTAINDAIPDARKSSLTYFKASICYFPFIIIAELFGFFKENSFQNFIVTMVAFAAYIYMIYFASKKLESAIEGGDVGFLYSLKAFGYMWLFPIGLWYIQPAVKRVLDHYRNEQNI